MLAGYIHVSGGKELRKAAVENKGEGVLFVNIFLQGKTKFNACLGKSNSN